MKEYSVAKTAKKTKTKKTSGARKAVSGKKHKMKPDYANVTVTGGVGAPNPVTVAPGELLHFSNNDNEDYLIELFINGMHPIVAMLLPALGDARLMADSHAKNGDRCAYDLVPTALQNKGKVGGGGGGTHTIIISSGSAESIKAAAVGR
jgi:hypothetical protein